MTQTVQHGRTSIRNILDGTDSRKFVIVGPCSIHDAEVAHDYAARLKEVSDVVSDRIVVIVRSYFEKPRTSLGWKGLIYDPHLNGAGDIKDGLYISRRILMDNLEIGLPCATEYLEPFTPQYNSDLVSWAAIGARTTESPQHRQLASRSLNARWLQKQHSGRHLRRGQRDSICKRRTTLFWELMDMVLPSVVRTTGNPYTHLVIRGSNTGVNYDSRNVQDIQGDADGRGTCIQML